MSDEFDCGHCGESSRPSEFSEGDGRTSGQSIDVRCPKCQCWTEQPLTGSRRRGSR